MGRVYVAEQIAMRRQVALKVILAEQASDSTHRLELVRRFQREAQAASLLQHTNTVRVFDFGHTDDGVLFLAMELLRGETLAQVLRLDQRLMPRRIARMGCSFHS
jgi:serine/threonine-protein kinase